jgi:lysophospholipase L1-like esterase
VRLGSYTDSTTLRACEDTVQITGNAVANKPIQYAVYDNHYNLIEEGSMTLSILGTVPASQKMLLIGDSFIATSGGYFGSCLRDLFTADGNTLTLVGTKGTSPKNHEGYSGKKYTDFANGFSGSPFGESGFNFSSYMSAHGYSGLSSVYIQLGTNDVSATNPNQDLSGVIAAMKTIVNSIRSYSTSIKIYVGMTVMPNLDSVTFANTYNGTGFNWIMKQNMLRLNDLIIKEYGESSSVTLVANNCILDNTEDILDNVHPTNAGFAKMAKQLYYTMMS